MPVPAGPEATPGDEVVSWVDPSGVVTILNDQPELDVEWGLAGRFMPPVQYAEDEVPLEPGARLRQTRIKPREITLPISVLSATPGALRTRLRALVGLFNPLRGDGRLRVLSADGTTRELYCRYYQGLQIEERFETVTGWQRAVIVLRAVDPFWYASAASQVTFAANTTTAFFPLFPMVLNADNILGTQTVTNPGDVEAYPLWVIQGPVSSILLTNNTTGRVIDLPVALVAGQSVTIDTRPGAKTVVRNDGTNLFGSLTTVSSLWTLDSGLSSITITTPGTTADSYVSLTYTPRYLTV